LGDGADGDFALIGDEHEFAAVVAPAGTVAAVGGSLPFARAAREGSDVKLIAAALGGGVGDPAAVGRNTVVYDGGLRIRRRDHEERRLIALGSAGVQGVAVRTVGPDKREVLAIGRIAGEANSGRTRLPDEQLLAAATIRCLFIDGGCGAAGRLGVAGIEQRPAVGRPGRFMLDSGAEGEAAARTAFEVDDPNFQLG